MSAKQAVHNGRYPQRPGDLEHVRALVLLEQQNAQLEADIEHLQRERRCLEALLAHQAPLERTGQSTVNYVLQ